MNHATLSVPSVYSYKIKFTSCQSQTGGHSSPSFLVSLQHMSDSEISNMAPGRMLHALASVPARSRLS